MADLDFDMPQNQSSSIKVIGVGGGGSNAVNYMYHKGIKGVDFVVCNTDQQALDDSPVPTKIQLGVSVTEGLGAGAWPLKGRMAAEENIKDVIDVLECNTKMVFINAGMGGGTGTGAAPVIAKAAREMDILTVAIVTIPFVFEGELRMSQAKEGIEELKQHVDSLIVINNNKLREIYGNLGFKSGFAKADEILATASRGIAEVITQKGHLNIDLNDAKTVLSNSGTAIMGSGTALGPGRAIKAVKGAIESPLLDNNHIRGAKKVLLLIVSGAEEVTFEEMGEISDFIQDQVMIEGGSPADIIMGVAEDEELESAVNVTVVATGFHEGKVVNPLTGIPEKVVHDLEDKIQPIRAVEKPISTVMPTEDQLVVETANEVKHILTEDDGQEEVRTETPETVVQEIVEQHITQSPGADATEPQQQVSMTFEFEVAENTNEPVLSHREEPKVVFNLLEEVEEERLEIENSVKPKVELKSDEIEDEVFDTESLDSAIEEESISFELESDSEQAIEETPINFSLDEPVATNGQEQKIVHTLSLDEDEEESFSFEPTQMETEESVSATIHENLVETVVSNPEPVGEKVLQSMDVELEPVHEEVLVDAVEKPTPVKEKLSVTLSTHSKALQEQIDRAQKRKDRLQKFNYRFRNSSVIDMAESEPAYKRQGVQLNEAKHSSEETISRLSLNTNEDGEIELKSKNSFLHDNVD
jgi:cell division protein FtsZ